MNKVTRAVLKHLCKQLVKQGPEHKNNITEYFAIMRQAAQTEFTEDNKPTLDAFLKECYEGNPDVRSGNRANELLKEVEKFLSQKWDWNTGPWDEQTAKEHLKKKIAAMNENTSRT